MFKLRKIMKCISSTQMARDEDEGGGRGVGVVEVVNKCEAIVIIEAQGNRHGRNYVCWGGNDFWSIY